jgi:DNA-binding CsgD family transcriptional regulator
LVLTLPGNLGQHQKRHRHVPPRLNLQNYEHLTAAERATLMVMRADGCSQRAVARCLGRSPSTSRELARNASCCKPVGDRIGNRAEGMLRRCEAASLPRGEEIHGSRWA